MFVRDRMITQVITITPDVSVNVAMETLHQNKIRHLPVVDEHGNLIGIVTDKSLLAVVPSSATSLSKREMNYILTRLKVKDVMTTNVITVGPDTPLEEAAVILSDNKISGLPVMSGGKLIGILTDTDVFRTFTYMLGGRRAGVRATAMISGAKGTLAKITAAIAAAGGDILTFSEYQDDNNQWHLTLKVRDISKDKLVAVLQDLPDVIEKIVDVRESSPILSG